MDLGFRLQDGLWCTRMGAKLEVFERKETMGFDGGVNEFAGVWLEELVLVPIKPYRLL
jgi:hypothetical protein